MSHAIVWFRRDLRLSDNKALNAALRDHDNVTCVFNFDPYFLDPLESTDKRLSVFIEALGDLDASLREKASALVISHGDPQKEIPQLLKQLSAKALYLNRDYTPYALKRDTSIRKSVEGMGIQFNSFKDHVIFEPEEIEKPSGGPYTVFTPFKKRWLSFFEENESLGVVETVSKAHFKSLSDLETLCHSETTIRLFDSNNCYQQLGFQKQSLIITPTRKAGLKRLNAFMKNGVSQYHEKRDFPAIEGTSALSVHIRFGLISVRECLSAALSQETPLAQNTGAMEWVSELIWREFYQMILGRFPHVKDRAFKEKYDDIQWQGEEGHFEKWCQGQTGFPIIDAAMRAFNETGLMHNRLRMVVASFLCKTLLLDWRLGEAYFAKGLLDFELASNNGGWQWASSSGCDAQPYFRIFNPHAQAQKFDPQARFIKQYCPELASFSPKACWDTQFATIAEQKDSATVIGKEYPSPIVSYKDNRARALAMYKM